MNTSFDLHQEAFDAVNRWWRAWVDRDETTVAAMAASDYMERNGMGRLQTLGPGRLGELLSCDSRDCSITDWELFDPVTRLFEHVVVCSYAFRFSGKRGGQLFLYEGRATDVLTRKDEQWTFVLHEGVLDSGRLVS